MVGPSSPSMKDVAARAEVSQATVSNVLNRPHLVSDRTRRRVQAAIDDLGFVRNDSARQLRGGRSRTIAFVMLDVSNPFFTDVARGVQAATDEAGLTLYLCNSGEDPGRQDAYLDLLEQQRVEGVLITPVERADHAMIGMASRGTPIVVVARGHDHGLRSVSVDDVLGGDLAVTHLLDSGHRHVAFVGRPTDLGQAAARLVGARRAIEREGVGDLTVLETTRLNGAEGRLDVAEGRRAGERLAGIPASRRPSAAFCTNDLVALGLLQQAVRMGLRVPEDLAIVGYDDIEFAEAATVPLTTVAQPRHLLGRTAVDLLLARARSGTERADDHVMFEPELVVRASTLRSGGRRA